MKIIIILFIVLFLNGCFGNTNKYLWKKPVQEVTQEVKNLNNKNEISADELVQQKRKDKKERKEKIAHLSKIGEGSYTWENGDTYDGSWFNLNMNGPGTMYFKNGTKYVGNWKDGIMWGDGILFDVDGSILKQGEWVLGGFKEDVIKRKKIEEQIKIKNKKIKAEEEKRKRDEIVKRAEEARKKEEAARMVEERRKEIIEEKRIAKEKREQEIITKKEKEIFDNAKVECEAIGYKKGTEKFGECVLDLTE
jgi:hypothetical protein